MLGLPLHLAQCSILPGRGRSRLALPVRVVVLRRKVHLSIAQRTLGARVSKHEATNDTTGRRRVVGARSRGGQAPPPATPIGVWCAAYAAPPTHNQMSIGRPMVGLARRVRPRPGRTCAATGFSAVLSADAIARPRRGDLEILRGQGWQPSPNGGPRDTGTCALQRTASIIHRYLLTDAPSTQRRP